MPLRLRRHDGPASCKRTDGSIQVICRLFLNPVGEIDPQHLVGENPLGQHPAVGVVLSRAEGASPRGLVPPVDYADNRGVRAFPCRLVGHNRAWRSARLDRVPGWNAAVTADFGSGLISSNGGLVLLREAELRLRLADTLAGSMRDRRDPATVPGSESLPPVPGRLALIPLAFRSAVGGAAHRPPSRRAPLPWRFDSRDGGLSFGGGWREVLPWRR